MATSANKNLHNAKTGKNDEFYTQLSDIEKELRHYKEHFKGKVVFCNCDDPRVSNFFHYFSFNFEVTQIIYNHEKGHGCYKCEKESRIKIKLKKYRICKICNIEKEYSEFYPNYTLKCKECFGINTTIK